MNKSGSATAALVAVTAVWGSTFVVMKAAIELMPPVDFLAWRFLLAAGLMLLLRPKALRSLPSTGGVGGVVAGAALAAGYVLQTVGLQTTSASVSGFVTGMFVVLTPLASAVLLRTLPTLGCWCAVALSTLGLAVLALRDLSLGGGELLTLLGAVAFALHIVALGKWAPGGDAYSLTVVQLVVVGVACACLAAPGGVDLPRDGEIWRALLLTAVLATALAYVVQTWAQQHVPATSTAVIMTMEPVFAGVFAAWAGEEIGPRGLIGGALIVAAMLVAQLTPDSARSSPRRDRAGASPPLAAAARRLAPQPNGDGHVRGS